ncbi:MULTISPECIES: histidine utilization repressor [Vibrio]|uniref:Histidine utilization repressor n=1 Tax=Vibrio casei TaxID=673372 RepID=A0A368LLK0_9VIBR|nr:MULTISPECIES: histidine utilization repressor [Vibrio]RCS72717.1 histidine utilization repressor [Vibrio casei]SJN39625.1 Histidine utilization repressor [Vibrio casei]HBV74988.1 histidine utilization repressor [Vibrio sp.]
MAQNIPRYKQIKQHILERIRNNEYPLNHKIPTENDLANQFQVSRMTAHKAIRDLVQEGYLVRKAGLGSFVVEPKAESPLTGVNNIADEITSRGHQYHCDILKLEEILADDEIALQMGMRLGVLVFHSLIIHYQDDTPIQVEERFVNPLLAPSYLENDFESVTPNAFLVKHCPLSDLEHTVEASFAPKQVCQWLAMEQTMPCLLVTRRTWSQQQLVSFARLWHPADKYKLRSAIKL